MEAGQALDHQPRSSLRPEKKQRARRRRLAAQHPHWARGLAEAVWWSRLAQPTLPTWACAGRELRLLQKRVVKDDPQPTALAGDGRLVRTTPCPAEQVWLRFAAGPPVSGLTTQLLAWYSERRGRLGKQALLLLWENASGLTSQAVRQWLGTHNRTVKQAQRGVRMGFCRLPSQSPWLNRIEPRWVHGNRAVLEPQRVLTAIELETRVYAYYGNQPEPHLAIIQKDASSCIRTTGQHPRREGYRQNLACYQVTSDALESLCAPPA